MKDRLINQIVWNATEIMEAKIAYNELVIEQLDARGDDPTAFKLREDNVKTQAAIDHMRKNEGCWG